MARKETASRPKILLVDGYNVLRSGSRYQEAFAHPDYTDDAFNTARERLINDVINFAGREYKAVIVFDGGDNQFSTGEVETIGGVRTVHPGKESAPFGALRYSFVLSRCSFAR